MAHKLVILTYHRILSEADPLRPGDMPADCFQRHMQLLSRYFSVLPLRVAVDRMEQGSLPSRAVSITFDDGYADNHALAWPILRQLHLPATIFVASGFLDGGRMWNDTVIEAVRRFAGVRTDLEDIGLGCCLTGNDAERNQSIARILKELKHLEPVDREQRAEELAKRATSPLPNDLMLRREQVRELCDQGVEIGAHTITHPILSSVDTATAESEIAGGKQELEEITAMPVRSFAYPNGRPGVDYSFVHADIAKKAGLDIAVSTSPGAANHRSDTMQLPRFGPWVESSIRFGVRMLRMRPAATDDQQQPV